jgi:macrolide-specific efflux system membrane fusion protein
MKRKRWIALAVLILLAAVAGASFVWRANGRRVVYQSVAVSRGDVKVQILSTGSVAPENRLDLKSPVAGRVEKVLVQEGDKVRSGQTLALVSSTERAALIDTAKAKGKQELEYWQDAYKMTPILAPKNGLIILKNADSGQSVTQSDIIVSMSDRLIVKANVDETDLAEIKIGQRAEVILDAFSKQPLPAKVVHIGYDAKTINNVTTYEVDVLTDHIPDFMKSGMTANITYLINERDDVLVIPAAAVHREHKKTFVLVDNPEGGEPKQMEIETGISDGKKFEVVSGLSEGDKILASAFKTPGGHAKPGEPPMTSPFGGGGGGGIRR